MIEKVTHKRFQPAKKRKFDLTLSIDQIMKWHLATRFPGTAKPLATLPKVSLKCL
jgi:hypothetical protein